MKERYFIAIGERENVSVEKGWLYIHDDKLSETATTIDVYNPMIYGDYSKQTPKELLLEISEGDYQLICQIGQEGYDSCDIRDQIIKYRKGEGAIGKQT